MCLLCHDACRYVLNYMPFGLVYKICNLLPCKLLIVSLRELYRAHQIHYGFIYASSKFQSSAFAVFIYTVVVGWYTSRTSSRTDSELISFCFHHFYCATLCYSAVYANAASAVSLSVYYI